MNITEIINQIEADKRKRKIVPTHSLLREIEAVAREKYDADAKRVKDELNKLYKQKKIKVGKTINDKFVILIQ